MKEAESKKPVKLCHRLSREKECFLLLKPLLTLSKPAAADIALLGEHNCWRVQGNAPLTDSIQQEDLDAWEIVRDLTFHFTCFLFPLNFVPCENITY
jgi:hypothetical protein